MNGAGKKEDAVLISLILLGVAIAGIVVFRFLKTAPAPEADRREAFAGGLSKRTRSRNLAAMIIMIVITAVLLPACLYMIVIKGYSDDVNNFSFGTIGVLLGYWIGFKKN
jgi:ABC-type Fe3+ transport system permease subunit